MASTISQSTENHCFDAVFDAASLSNNIDVSFGHVEAENEDNEKGDMDFDPFSIEAPSLEAFSSLFPEIEDFDVDVMESGENFSLVPSVADGPDELQEYLVGNNDRCEQTVMQAGEEIEPTTEVNTVSHITAENSQPLVADRDGEDVIWKRTRYSRVGCALDEVDTFLQEIDDEDDLHHNMHDKEEYMKSYAAVLLDEDARSRAAQESENASEDGDNDADLVLEIEEALQSDDDETLPISPQEQEQEHEHVVRSLKTRQEKRQKIDLPQNKFSGQHNRPFLRSYMVPSTSTHNVHVSAFTPHQIGQLHCMIYEHVQLLIQVFSLTVLEPFHQHISTQVCQLLSEMLRKHHQLVASQRVSYPGYCFQLPYIQSTIEDGLSWVPVVNDNVLSVTDVAPLGLVQRYINDVSIVVQEHNQRQLGASYVTTIDKERLFPYENFHSTAKPTADKTSNHKSMAAALLEKSKQQSVALVPKEIANLALRFFRLFNPALIPYKPPPASLANRVTFTDAEDGLLARGFMQYGTNWKEIQKNFLPCKDEKKISMRKKNLVRTLARENQIKAVRRMKTSPLTPEEIAVIQEGIKVFKSDWMSICKYVVPERDPKLLPRQWRTACGKQKSYKADEITKAKRRLYDLRRRWSKLEATNAYQNKEGWSNQEATNPLPGFPRCSYLSDKEKCSTYNTVKKKNGDDGVNNEDEAYVLQKNQSVELVTHHRLTNSRTSQRVPAKNFRSSGLEVNVQSYQVNITDGPRLVKLAPDLLPVILPSTVRVMSQSAFTKYRDEATNEVRESLSHPRTSQLHDQNSVRCDAVENDYPDLQMHPLLFEDVENVRTLPSYPLNGNAGSCSSFDHFTSNPPQSSSSHRVLALSIRSGEFVMEQEDLSDSEEEEMGESVEFGYEVMTDSGGGVGSDFDHSENVQVEDVQDDTLRRVTTHGDDSTQDESRCQENHEPQVTKSSHANRSFEDTTLSHTWLDAAMLVNHSDIQIAF